MVLVEADVDPGTGDLRQIAQRFEFLHPKQNRIRLDGGCDLLTCLNARQFRIGG